MFAMAEENAVKLSKVDSERLEQSLDLLHVIYHRNLNQHRRSVWWRHFSVFRRQFIGIIREIRSMNEVPTTHLERSRKKIIDEETRSKILQRRNLWRDTLVPKWQNSFSQIVADGRFAALGLVLIAVLAQACQIVGITQDYDDLRQMEIEKVLEEFGKEEWNDAPRHSVEQNGSGEDMGEVITRGKLETNFLPDETLPPAITEPSKDKKGQLLAHAKGSKPARKKRKTANAIDDLFGGLD